MQIIFLKSNKWDGRIAYPILKSIISRHLWIVVSVPPHEVFFTSLLRFQNRTHIVYIKTI